LVAVGAQLNLAASFTDVDVGDTHTAQWTWGDATGEYGIVTEAAGAGTDVTGAAASISTWKSRNWP